MVVSALVSIEVVEPLWPQAGNTESKKRIIRLIRIDFRFSREDAKVRNDAEKRAV